MPCSASKQQATGLVTQVMVKMCVTVDSTIWICSIRTRPSPLPSADSELPSVTTSGISLEPWAD